MPPGERYYQEQAHQLTLNFNQDLPQASVGFNGATDLVVELGVPTDHHVLLQGLYQAVKLVSSTVPAVNPTGSGNLSAGLTGQLYIDNSTLSKFALYQESSSYKEGRVEIADYNDDRMEVLSNNGRVSWDWVSNVWAVQETIAMGKYNRLAVADQLVIDPTVKLRLPIKYEAHISSRMASGTWSAQAVVSIMIGIEGIVIRD